MSRKMDNRAAMLAELKAGRATITEMGREKRKLEARMSEIEQSLIKSMGKSTIGTINGKDAIKIYESERSSIRIETAKMVCPDLVDKLITKTQTKKVKFL